MKIPIIKQISLYNYRYIIGYVLYASLVSVLLVLSVTDIPRGLTTQEMASATASATSSMRSILLDDPINAPYTLLQKTSMHFFGITPIAIKLPSIILGVLTALTLILMLRQWFHDNVAILTSIIVATAGPFLTMGRTGTPLILYGFWLSLILFAATKKLYGKEKTFKWKLLFFVAAALSLYTPLVIYPLIAIAIAGLLHPHVRYTLSRMSGLKLAIVLTISAILLVPLVWSIARNPDHISTLLGLPSGVPDIQNILTNLAIFYSVLFDFGNNRIGSVMLPLFNAATMILIGLGVLRSIRDRHSARAYMLLIWTGLILIGVVLNPVAITVLYMPLILFLAVGIETLIREWYRLFPRNPYARIAALIPLTILLVSISTSNVARYFYGYTYGVNAASFNQELEGIREMLGKPVLNNKPVAIVTSQDDAVFYDLLRRDYDNVTVSQNPDTSKELIVLETRYSELSPAQKDTLTDPYRLFTSGSEQNSLLFRVYVSK